MKLNQLHCVHQRRNISAEKLMLHVYLEKKKTDDHRSVEIKMYSIWFYVAILMYHEKLKVQLGVTNGQW
jgi:hypothetical protein